MISFKAFDNAKSFILLYGDILNFQVIWCYAHLHIYHSAKRREVPWMYVKFFFKYYSSGLVSNLNANGERGRSVLEVFKYLTYEELLISI